MKPLNPIMAVLVIASVGAVPLRTLAADGTKAPDAKAVAAAAEKPNSINALSKILAENADARKDAGKRIEEFLLETKGGKSFVAIDVNTTLAGTVAREWGEKKGPVGSVAILYFVMGPGSVQPSWAAADSILKNTFVPNGTWEPRLRIALADWTGKSQISKDKEKKQVSAFLTEASAKSAKVFAETRDAAQREESINRNNTTEPVVPDLSGSNSRLNNGTTRDYTLKDLYEDGAVVTEVYGPGDTASRKISMKIYTRRLDDGRVVDEIGIYDITNKSDIFGQRFSLGGGDQSFILDDRKPGHKKYELKFGAGDDKGQRTVTFQRPGTDMEKKNGVALETDLAALFMARANQAAQFGKAGDVAKVGDKEFYVLPQGGGFGGLVFLPKAEMDARSPDNIRGMSAGLFAVTSMRGEDGWSQRVPIGPKGGPDLGKVGDKEYHLVWNAKLTPPAWEVTDGPGDPPPAPKKPRGGAAGAGDGATTGDGSGDQSGSGNGSGNTGKESTIAELTALLMKAPNCRVYENSTKDMAPELKGKYGVVMCNPKKLPEEETAIILTPLAVVSPGQQLVFNSSKQSRIVHARIVGHYVVLQFDSQVQYLDIRKRIPAGFELVATVMGENGKKEVNGPPVDAGYARKGAPDTVIVLDALRSFMGVPASDKVFTELEKRVKDRFKGKPYELVATQTDGGLVVTANAPNGANSMIWPKDAEQPTAPPAPELYAHLGGTSTVFEPETSSTETGFQPKIPISQSFELVLEGPAQKDIALYKATDPTGKEKDMKKYYLSFNYKGYDTKTSDPASQKVERTFQQKYFELFTETAPLPEGRTMQGLTGVKDPIVRGLLGYRFIAGTNKTRGVVAVFQNAAVTGEGQKDAKANCVGPIVWWGISSREAALKVCTEDKF